MHGAAISAVEDDGCGRGSILVCQDGFAVDSDNGAHGGTLREAMTAKVRLRQAVDSELTELEAEQALDRRLARRVEAPAPARPAPTRRRTTHDSRPSRAAPRPRVRALSDARRVHAARTRARATGGARSMFPGKSGERTPRRPPDRVARVDLAGTASRRGRRRAKPPVEPRSGGVERRGWDSNPRSA